MSSLLRRTLDRVGGGRFDSAYRHAQADRFLALESGSVVPPPNGRGWRHAVPLPDGTRIRGASADPLRETKLWAACFGGNRDCLAGRRVLDVRAGDGFFTVAALLCGAETAHAVIPPDDGETPDNLRFIAGQWGVTPIITGDDFRTLAPLPPGFDVILFFGGLTRLADPFAGVQALRRLLAPGGRIYLETEVIAGRVDRAVLEVSGDPTAKPPTLVPNEQAVRALASRVGLSVEGLREGNPHESAFGNEHRRVFVLSERKVAPKG